MLQSARRSQPHVPHGWAFGIYFLCHICDFSAPRSSNAPELGKREKGAWFSEVSLYQSDLLTALRLKRHLFLSRKREREPGNTASCLCHSPVLPWKDWGPWSWQWPHHPPAPAHPNQAHVTASTLQGKLADLGRGWGEEAASLLCNSDGNVLLGLFTICWAHRHFSIWSLINVLTTKPHQTGSTGISEALVYKVNAAAFLSNSNTFYNLRMAWSAVGLNLLRQIFVINSYHCSEVSQMNNIWKCLPCFQCSP